MPDVVRAQDWVADFEALRALDQRGFSLRASIRARVWRHGDIDVTSSEDVNSPDRLGGDEIKIRVIAGLPQRHSVTFAVARADAVHNDAEPTLAPAAWHSPFSSVRTEVASGVNLPSD